MPMTPAAAKKYKPRREPGSLDDVVYSDTKKAAMDEAKAMKDTEDATAAYNKSLTTEGKKKGGSIRSAKYMSFSKTGKPAGMKSVTKMSSGGKTASSRADGCCTKGKTRGKMY